MALVSAENLTAQAEGFNALPAIRQAGLMIGLALSVAFGVTVALWTQAPNFSLLYSNLSAKDLSQVTSALDSITVQYKIESGGTTILVEADRVHEARMKLASQGLSLGTEVGFELLEKDQGFGSSSFIQKARYHRALEGELAQSVSKLSVVESARVHIAIPKKSVFARDSAKPTVSVVLNLYPGRELDEAQVAGIINMVASSIAELDTKRVTVIDQKGRLLSGRQGDNNLMLSSTQFEHTRRLEERYVQSILDIITPITGIDGVRAQVVADVDFTSQEETRESYQPEQGAIRSEQLFEESSSMPSGATGGVPGALSNQPPAAGGLEYTQAGNGGNTSSRAVRNYEIDRTISHKRQAPASLKRLSVAVVIDYRSKLNEKGKVVREPLTEDDIKRIESLIKESVGLDEARGDTINVVNTAFQQAEAMEPVEPPPLWELAWVQQLAKQILGGLVVILIAFGMLRPMLKNLATPREVVMTQEQLQHESLEGLTQEEKEEQLALGDTSGASNTQLQEIASTMAKEDPKRVAQVLNEWVATDG